MRHGFIQRGLCSDASWIYPARSLQRCGMDLSGAVFAAMLFVWRDVCDVKDGDLVQHGFVWLLCV
jgi:hypothetical protein